LGDPDRSGLKLLWLRVPKVGSGMVSRLTSSIDHLPPPPVIGETRNPVAGAPLAQR
jgi:hypothetical protein